MQIKIEKTQLGFLGESIQSMVLCDTILYQGKLWLVPQWLEGKRKGKTKPARLICLDFLAHSKAPDARWGFDYMLNQPFPRDVFEGRAPLEIGGQNQVIENPNVEFDHPNTLQ